MMRWELHERMDEAGRTCAAESVGCDTIETRRNFAARVSPGMIAAVLVAGVLLAAPLAAYAADHATAVPAYSMTPKRLAASSASLAGLIGAVIGGVALARSRARIGNGGRRGATVAVVLGPIALIVGGLVVATADGGLGTGNGLAGGVVAIILGLIGSTLGGLTLSRSRPTA